MFKKAIVPLLLALSVATIATPVAFAADDTRVTVQAGALTITNPAADNFPAVTLGDTAQTVTAALATFTVRDQRGSGAGWRVTAAATQFKEIDGAGAYVTGGKTLPTNSLQASAPTVAANGTTSAVPTLSAGPYTIDAGSAVTVASAATNAGMGRYDFGATTLSLTVPANAYATGYRSDVTISVIAGP